MSSALQQQDEQEGGAPAPEPGQQEQQQAEQEPQQAVQQPQQPLKITAEQLGIVAGSGYAGQLDFDLGNLSAFDPAPLNPAEFTPLSRDASCQAIAAAMTQALVGQLFALPGEAVQGGRLAQLPPPSTALPREKPIPKPKPLTKWQKFAQEKGIRKRKRSKLVYDDESGDWKRRHGYGRANDDADVPVIEARAGDVPGEDPFTQLRQEKRERARTQAKQQLANVKQAMKAGGAAALPATLRLAAALPTKGRGQPAKRRELRDEIKTASWLSGVSTASMGKFDRRLPGEKEGERALPGKRRKFMGVTDAGAERALMAKAADRLLREKADDVLDINKAIGKLEAQARQSRHEAKAAAGEDGGGGGRRGGRKGGRGGGSSRGGGRGGKGGKQLGARGGGVQKGGRGSSRGGGRGGKAGGRGGGKAGGRGGKGKR